MSEPKSDKSLLGGVNTSAASWAEKLDEQYRAKLCALVEREMDGRLRRREDAEDVVQTAFRTFYRRNALGEFHIDGNGQLWQLLATITRRKALKHITKIKAKKRSLEKEEQLEPDASVSTEPDPLEAVVAVDLVEKMLEGLDEFHADVFHLRLQGCSERDIAKRMDCTRQAVTTVLERLRNRLAKLLEHADRLDN